MANLTLAVFDFDGTLFRSPERPSWYDTTWYTSEASLGQPCVPDVPGSDWWIASTIAAAKKAISDPDVYAVLLTGRSATHANYRHRVPELLKQQGLHFDEVHLHPGGAWSPDATPAFKSATVAKLLGKFDFDALHMWDDEPKNFAAVNNVINRFGVAFNPHLVNATRHPLTCTWSDIQKLVTDGWLKPDAMRHVQTPMVERVAARWMTAVNVCNTRDPSLAWIDPKGKVHFLTGDDSHRDFADKWVAANKIQISNRSWPTEYFFNEGWMRVGTVLDLTVKSLDATSPATWAAYFELARQCPKIFEDPELTNVTIVFGTEQRNSYKTESIAELLKKYGNRAIENAFYKATMSKA